MSPLLHRPLRHPFRPFVWLAAILLLAACSPQFDWREVHGTAPAPFTVLLPAKPSSMTRPIKLGDISTSMTMTGVEVKGITFAVGSAELPDAAHARAALDIMKTALLQNTQGKLRREKATANGSGTRIEIEALGATDGCPPRLLQAHFIASERRVYQVVLLGPEAAIPAEASETFFGSFKPE